jgi:signal transduction histidine kinase
MRARNSQSTWLLLVGFGGLLSLLAFAGAYGISTIRTIGSRNDRIRSDYLLRDRILQQLRSDLYLSGTHIRDLLLEANPAEAELHRQEFDRTKRQIDSNRAAYQRILRREERPLFDKFSVELDRYFSSLRPALAWSANDRRTRGLAFMKESLLPERMLVVQLADQLSAINGRQLEAGNRQIAQLFNTFQGSLIAFTLFSLVAGTLLAGFTTQRLLRLERVSNHQVQELSELSGRLVQAQESERRAISRELHDEVGQAVSGLLLEIGNVAAVLPSEQSSVALGQLQDLRGLAERTLAVVRNLSLLLRPSMLDDLGLVPALQWQARETSRTGNISVQVSPNLSPEHQVSEESKTCIYRVVQEALTNITRHSRATAVTIRLSAQAGDGLHLSIEDNGRGFVPSRDKGLGILGMEERVRHLNGTLSIRSKPGGGATLEVHLPA